MKRLVLHVEVPDYNVDDLEQSAAEFGDSISELVLNFCMRPEVGLTFVTIPNDGCLNEEFEIVVRECTVVGAHVIDSPAPVADEVERP